MYNSLNRYLETGTAQREREKERHQDSRGTNKTEGETPVTENRTELGERFSLARLVWFNGLESTLMKALKLKLRCGTQESH